VTAILNASTMPLHGRHLIEASAGTGKTFTVANLYVRLLIDSQHETPLTVENILVVTFTNAATEELRARLRARIAVALQVLNGDSPADADSTLIEVLEPYRSTPATVTRLELAYQCMDQAAIFTIHGFCDRVLREQAFESGELFDAELQADVDALKLLAAEAWWRSSVTPLSGDETEVIPKGWRSPGGALKRLATVITDPASQLVPQFTENELQQAQATYESAWQSFSAAWAAGGEVWAEQVLAGVNEKLINKGKAPNLFTVDTVVAATHFAVSLAQQERAPSSVDQCLSLLGNTAICMSANKRKNNPPQSVLGDQIDALLESYGKAGLQKLVTLQNNAKTEISRDLIQRKLIARQRTFDDLLLQLHGVLYGDNGDRLTAILRKRYPVGLIDEFQDTDRIQFEIFDKVFPGDPGSLAALYLIGDPKQSIYRFRGADIDIYLRARDSADGIHPLDKNWRSSSRLLNAFNAMYAQSKEPFGSADIQYQPVSSGGKAEDRPLTIGGEVLPPLQFDCTEVHEAKMPVIGVSIRALAQSCARRIASMLTAGNATLGTKPVVAKDIAVLVWTHKHAEAIRHALRVVGVDSAMQSRESVFRSTESLDMLALLGVIARPGDSASLSRVLVSPLCGYSAHELLQQRDDAASWQRIEDAVQLCRETCWQAGPQAAVLRFMSLFSSRAKAEGTWAAKSRGIDRILGNYLHLAEVLQTAWQEQPDLLVLLKTAQRWRAQGVDEAMQLRLESDAALVQIMTVHKSKGLQFPVVMLPFACIGKDPAAKGPNETRGSASFSENGKPRLDVGSDQLNERLEQLAQAQQDESMRALYVALTRAEQSCWIGVAASKNAKYAALWKLLAVSFPVKMSETDDCQQPIDNALDLLVSCSSDIAKTKALTEHNALSSTQSTDTTHLARAAKRYVKASWRIGSYTGLVRGATHAVEQPDHDTIDVPTTRPETIDFNSPFHFLRGKDAGTLIHAVFEHLDFRNSDQKYLHGYTEEQLQTHGIDKQWVPALCNLVRNTLDTPLNEIGFSLSQLDNSDRLDELEFHFPVKSLQAEQLVDLLRNAGVMSADDGLSFEHLDGYMKGFIDLTFRHNGRWYIADYKSNHLGYETKDYHQAAIEEAMKHHRYDLQYLIYAVALRRYLNSRLPEFNSARDFGGVYYLFVRGMSGEVDAEQRSGVYAARPPEQLLDALDQLLGGRIACVNG